MSAHYPFAIPVAALLGSLFVACCGNTPTEPLQRSHKVEYQMVETKTARTPVAWETERNTILGCLHELRDTNVQRSIAANKGFAHRRDQEQMKAELAREKDMVEDLTMKTENATSSSWSDTRTEIKRSAENVKTWWSDAERNGKLADQPQRDIHGQ